MVDVLTSRTEVSEVVENSDDVVNVIYGHLWSINNVISRYKISLVFSTSRVHVNASPIVTLEVPQT